MFVWNRLECLYSRVISPTKAKKAANTAQSCKAFSLSKSIAKIPIIGSNSREIIKSFIGFIVLYSINKVYAYCCDMGNNVGIIQIQYLLLFLPLSFLI